MSDEALRYPIGKYQPIENPTDHQLEAQIQDIADLPFRLRETLAGMTDAQIQTPYRPGGWTVYQLVHHIGDSHLNSIIRFKWTLTEDNPTIKAYDEKLWAQTPDVANTSLELNLAFIEILHRKWVTLLKSMTREDFERTFTHPETGRVISLAWMVGLYAWHGKHHTAHIQRLKDLTKAKE